MKIEGWEIQKYKQISPNESCYLTLPPQLYALCPVSRALWSLPLSMAGSQFCKTGRSHLCPQGKKHSAGERAHRTHSPCTWKICSSSVQKSNMPDLYTNSGDMIVTAHMVTSLAWEIIQKSANKHLEEEGRRGLLCCLPCASFFKVKCPDLFGADVLRYEKGWFGEFTAIMHNIRICPFIIV